MSNNKDRATKLQYDRIYTGTLKQQRRKEGLCLNCGKPARVGKTQCQTCSDYWAQRVVERRSKEMCPLCGELARAGKSLCQACTDYQTLRKAKKREEQKRRAVEYLGGQCIDCGLRTDIVDVYDFHHVHPEEKSATINRMMTKTLSWASIQEELDKCELLCANCHRIRHASEV